MEKKTQLGNYQKFGKTDLEINNNSLNNPYVLASQKQENLKDTTSSNLKEIDKNTFRIIQQKETLNLINNDSSHIEKTTDELSNNLYNINPTNDNYINKDNNNDYNLLKSYYKDSDLNNKSNFIKNKRKNFLPKDYFKEMHNYNEYNNYDNNSQNSFSYNAYPQINYQEQIPHNQNFFPYNNFNNQSFQFIFPENAFSINNQMNFYLTNNIKNYRYNFYLNKNKNNKKRKEYIEPNFFSINLDNILKGIDTRTTVMIRHIPNKYSYKNVLDEINTICKDKYDFFYLPLDSENNCNLGYAFINFIHPLHIVYFYNIFKSRKWLQFNSYKECDLTFAKYQGKYELTNIERNLGKSNNKKRLPIIFEIKNPPKIDLFKKYYDVIKMYRPELMNEINWK